MTTQPKLLDQLSKDIKKHWRDDCPLKDTRYHWLTVISFRQVLLSVPDYGGRRQTIDGLSPVSQHRWDGESTGNSWPCQMPLKDQAITAALTCSDPGVTGGCLWRLPTVSVPYLGWIPDWEGSRIYLYLKIKHTWSLEITVISDYFLLI